MNNNERAITIREEKRRALDRLYRISYWFANEMFKYMEKEAAFKEKCEKAEKEGGTVVIMSAAENNKRCMQNCLKATTEIINYLSNDRTEDLEGIDLILEKNAENMNMWQIDGINAMLDTCANEESIPFDLPYAIQGVLGITESEGKQ